MDNLMKSVGYDVEEIKKRRIQNRNSKKLPENRIYEHNLYFENEIFIEKRDEFIDQFLERKLLEKIFHDPTSINIIKHLIKEEVDQVRNGTDKQISNIRNYITEKLTVLSNKINEIDLGIKSLDNSNKLLAQLNSGMEKKFDELNNVVEQMKIRLEELYNPEESEGEGEEEGEREEL
jgi:hypothetical protein